MMAMQAGAQFVRRARWHVFVCSDSMVRRPGRQRQAPVLPGRARTLRGPGKPGSGTGDDLSAVKDTVQAKGAFHGVNMGAARPLVNVRPDRGWRPLRRRVA